MKQTMVATSVVLPLPAELPIFLQNRRWFAASLIQVCRSSRETNRPDHSALIAGYLLGPAHAAAVATLIDLKFNGFWGRPAAGGDGADLNNYWAADKVRLESCTNN